MKTCIPFLILLTLSGLNGQISGFAEHWEAGPLGSGSDFQQRRDRLRLITELQTASLTFKISGELIQDSFSRPGLYWRWREAYAGWQIKKIGLRAGLQQVEWGRTRHIFLLDHINPQDWRYSYTWSRDDIRQGLKLLRGRVGVWGNDLEIIWIPRYVSDDPVKRGPWARSTSNIRFINTYSLLLVEQEPPFTLENEIGLRWAGHLAGVEYRFMYFSGYQDEPVTVYQQTEWQGEAGNPNSDVTVYFYQDHPRQEMVGMDLLWNRGWFSFTAELGKEMPFRIDSEPAFDDRHQYRNHPVNTGRWLGMAGILARLPAGMQVGSQFILRQTDQPVPAGVGEQEMTLTFIAPIPGLGMQCEIWHYTALTSTSSFTQGSVNWQYSSRIQLQAGLTLVAGESDTPFGPFAQNDHYFLLARLTF